MLYLAVFAFGFSIGCLVGGFLTWAKFHYPEAQAIIRAKAARAHAEAARYERDEAKFKTEEQQSYGRMIQ